jgi:hypothetical protein
VRRSEPNKGCRPEWNKGRRAKPNEGACAKPNKDARSKPNEGAYAKPNEGACSEPNEGACAKPDEGACPEPSQLAKWLLAPRKRRKEYRWEEVDDTDLMKEYDCMKYGKVEFYGFLDKVKSLFEDQGSNRRKRAGVRVILRRLQYETIVQLHAVDENLFHGYKPDAAMVLKAREDVDKPPAKSALRKGSFFCRALYAAIIYFMEHDGF